MVRSCEGSIGRIEGGVVPSSLIDFCIVDSDFFLAVYAFK